MNQMVTIKRLHFHVAIYFRNSICSAGSEVPPGAPQCPVLVLSVSLEHYLFTGLVVNFPSIGSEQELPLAGRAVLAVPTVLC